MGSLLPIPGHTAGLINTNGTPTTSFYNWLKSLFDTAGVTSTALSALTTTVNAILALFPGGTSSAWTSYTPTVTAGTGSFTTVSATGSYYQIGKVVYLKFEVTITAVGTAAAAMFVTVPVAAVAKNHALCGTIQQTAEACSGSVRAVDGLARVHKYDGTTAIAGAGRIISCECFYEAA